MPQTFVLEALMLAIYGELMVPDRPVEYLIPLSTIYELEELIHNPTPLMPDPEDESHVRKMMQEMADFFGDPFNRKRMEKGLIAPWSTISFPFPHEVQLTIVKAEDNALWGDLFDPIETELMLSSIHYETAMLTDQTEWQDRLLEYVIPVQFYDIDDFQFALEQGISLHDKE